MKSLVTIVLAVVLAGCCSFRGSDGDEIAELQHQRDQLIAMVIKIYQQKAESPEDVLPRVLATHPSAPSAADWSRNQSTLSLDALVQEVQWLKRICLEVPESPAALESLRRLSEPSGAAYRR